MCPHCGQRNPTVTNKQMVITAIVLIIIAVIAFKSCSSKESKSLHVSQADFIKYYGEIPTEPKMISGVRVECTPDNTDILLCEIVAPITGDKTIISAMVEQTSKAIAGFAQQFDATQYNKDVINTIEHAANDKDLKGTAKFGSDIFMNVEIKNGNAYIDVMK